MTVAVLAPAEEVAVVGDSAMVEAASVAADYKHQ